MKIISVVGARPNFMKIAPFISALDKYQAKQGVEIRHILVHTGQHYDLRMSEAFFSDLNIPQPDINLEIGSGTHAEQLGSTMIAFEKVLIEHKPDWVIVVGDVNATLACTVIAKRLNIKVCHIEAGLRSGDMRMPEEINRLVTDRLSDLLFTPDRMASEHLLQEGVPIEKIHFVGNIMIDTLDKNKKQAQELDLDSIIDHNLIGDNHKPVGSISDFNYGVLTMHRPSNVDQKDVLIPLIDFILAEAAESIDLLWPIHPRTKKRIETLGLWYRVMDHPKLFLLQPLRYHEMLRLNMKAKLMLTDSGGLQEECCVLGTPCLTLRWNTERPITLRENGGASVLVGNQISRIRKEFLSTLQSDRKPCRPELWDGHTAERIAEVLLSAHENS